MAKRSKSRYEGHVRLRIGALKDQATVLAQRQGHGTLAGYLRDLIARGISEDMRKHPAMHLRLRPGSTVFRMDGETFRPLAQGIGGERVWVLDVIPSLPTTLGGGLAYVADIVAGEGQLEGRAVVVRADDCV